MPSRLRASLAIALVLAPLSILAAACSSTPPEETILNQFFRAARTRDNETMARMSAVDWDVREQGEVSRFEITNVGEERRTPLNYKQLMEAQQRAAEAETAFRQSRVDFESANRPALETIAKLEREADAKFNPAQQKLKAEWDKWRQDAQERQKATASAKAALNNAMGPAEASLAQPGQPAFAADKFEGDLVSKDVTIDAQVRKGEETTQKTMVVTLQRVVGKQDGADRTGRWIIARIQER
jgi:F0F1-type ATP synthase membrane subunit b/b'